MGELETCTQNGRMCCDGFDNSHPCQLKRNKKKMVKRRKLVQNISSPFGSLNALPKFYPANFINLIDLL